MQADGHRLGERGELGGMPSGTLMASDSSTTICSAYAPGAKAEKPIGCTSLPTPDQGKATTGRRPSPLAGARAHAEHLADELVPHHDLVVGTHPPSYPVAYAAALSSSAWWRAWRSEPQMPQRRTSSSS